MSRHEKEGSNISFPWDESTSEKTVLQCPNCGNDGMDGSITGRSTQWGVTRICKKCDFKWQGGIGVQQADFSEPPPIPGIDTEIDDEPSIQYTGASYRDPDKNFE